MIRDIGGCGGEFAREAVAVVDGGGAVVWSVGVAPAGAGVAGTRWGWCVLGGAATTEPM